MKFADKYYIREINESLVLKVIINNTFISRADVSKVTGLNKATISSIVTTLLEKKLILEVGIGESSGGRKPVMLKFNEKTGFSLTIDLGIDYISWALTYLNGKIVKKYKEININVTKNSILNKLDNIISSNLEDLPETPYGIIGINVGVHGIVENNTIKFTPYYNLESLDIKEHIENKFNIDTTLENEANLAALGEKAFTNNYKNLININIHSGIGSGIILENRLFRGSRGHGGEIGHMIIEYNGLSCPCGNNGCMERYASEQVILSEYSKLTSNDRITFDDMKLAYNNSEKSALKAIDEFSKYIAIGINNIINSYNPEAIIINSNFTNELDGVIENIRNRLTSKLCKDIIIKSSTLKDNATLLGGTYINITNFLGVEDIHLTN